jgi:hypothetical protein
MIRSTNDPIFLHIPKTGGTSIHHALGIAIPNGHDCGLRRQLYEDNWDDRFKFTFIRNPWDRAVSWFFWHRYYMKYSTFERWVRRGLPCEEKPWFLEGHPNNSLDQKTFFCDLDGNSLVDFIGRFENLHGDFQTICRDHLNRHNVKLHHMQKSSQRPPYQTHYTMETREIVRERFADFIEEFEYEF